MMDKNTDKFKKLQHQFYESSDVPQIARRLIGKILVTNFGGEYCSVRIVETEAYIAITDKASHSYNGKRTSRNEHMYGEPGTAYVYTCYGIHQLFNVVTNKKGVPDAVLIRAGEPLEGVDFMLRRLGKSTPDYTITRGPGNLCRALGIHKSHSGVSLLEDEIFIAADQLAVPEDLVGESKRIGIDGAGDDAMLPYRFYLRGSKYVSGKPVK